MSVKVEKNGQVTTIILNRPEVKNAVNPETAQELAEAFLVFDADETANVAVFCGEGGAFCAGFDLKYAAQLNASEAMVANNLDSSWQGGKGDDVALAPMGVSRLTLSKPVIGAISGPAVAGGMELALWCDMRVMEVSAFMGVYCRRWGVPLIDGGTYRLVQIVGMGRAMDLILTGRKIEAEEALDFGLANRLVADGDARFEAEKLAHEIARFPQSCMRADRLAALNGAGRPLHEAMINEWKSVESFYREGITGAGAFAKGKGRGGDFSDITHD